MTENNKGTPKEKDNENGAPIRFKRFVIHELIGVGGMAEVYRGSAEQPDGGRVPIVLKRIKKEHSKNKSFVQMFVDEAKLSAQMKHPNIVEVFEYGQDRDIHYLTMEYIDGLHLQATHKRYDQKEGSPLPWQAVVLIVRDVLRGLHYAHELTDQEGAPLGLIHRDVNLDNVMIGRDGQVKLLDFGIVKAREGIRAAETAAGVLKGKFGYMSPEQVAGKPLKPNSDVFSTGIVFHELLTGQRLFYGDDDLSILMAVKSGPIPDPKTLRGEVPQEVTDIVLKALERDPEKRYATAQAMADELDALVKKFQIKEELLGHLMSDLLGPDREATGDQKTRRRKRTLESWRHGAPAPASGPGADTAKKKDAAQERPRMASGTLVAAHGADPKASGVAAKEKPTTHPGWTGGGDGGATLMDVPGSHGLDLSQAPGLDDGASTVVDGTVPEAEEAALTEGETRILGDDESPPNALTEGETRILGDDERAPNELTEQETRILGDDESAPNALALTEGETRILDDDQDAQEALAAADKGDEPSPQDAGEGPQEEAGDLSEEDSEEERKKKQIRLRGKAAAEDETEKPKDKRLKQIVAGVLVAVVLALVAYYGLQYL